MKIILLVILASYFRVYSQENFQEAQKYYSEKKYSGSLEILEDLIDNEERKEYYELAAKCAYHLNEYEDAMDLLDEIVEQESNNIELLRFYAEVLTKYADEAGALSQMMMVSKIRNNWEQILTLDPKDADVLGYLTRYYLFAPSLLGKDEEKGFEYLKRLEALDKKKSLIINVDYLREEEEYDEALKLLDNADKDFEYYVLEQRMSIYQTIGNEIKLEDTFVAIDSAYYDTENISVLYNSYGYYLLNEEQFEEAIYVFKRAVDKSPHSANPYDSLGDAYRAKGDITNAKRNYRKALEIDPDFEPSLDNLDELE